MRFRSLPKAALRTIQNEPTVRRTIARSRQPGTGPKDWFSGLNDEAWLWLNTAARRRRKAIASLLPQMPDDDLQANLTGQSGDSTLREAFGAYKIIKGQYEARVGPIGLCPRILDFGCGWGRGIRFFLKDVDGDKLIGVDHSEEIIRVCHETNRWCSFLRIEPFPPTSFAADSFGLIYLYFRIFQRKCTGRGSKNFVAFSNPAAC
jgi:Methyltransferase domain